MPKAKAAATKALGYRQYARGGSRLLGNDSAMSYEWDWAGAEREFQRAIELDPDYATAHHWYGICLAAIGRSEQAIASLKRAQELDPLSLIISADLGLELLFARRYDDAIAQVRKPLEMDPNFGVRAPASRDGIRAKGDVYGSHRRVSRDARCLTG